jgi:hypothetical protein
LYEYQKKLTEMFAGLTKAQRVKTANIANVLKGNHVAMADIARRVTQTQQMFVNSSLLTVARHIDEVRTGLREVGRVQQVRGSVPAIGG